jgi:hypothetical protein
MEERMLFSGPSALGSVRVISSVPDCGALWRERVSVVEAIGHSTLSSESEPWVNLGNL